MRMSNRLQINIIAALRLLRIIDNSLSWHSLRPNRSRLGQAELVSWADSSGCCVILCRLRLFVPGRL
jgi:hypothetical protein